MTEHVVESSAEIVLDLNEKKPVRVLHVDDEPSLLKIAKQCLEMQGSFQVDTASSVEEALEKLKTEAYDAVVSDYQMPGKDGLQFLKEVRENRNDIPFIIFTGKGREEVAIKAWNLGADHYVNKNGDPEMVYSELGHCLSEAVEKHVAETQVRETAQKLHAICDNAVEGICLVDPQENLVYVNKAFADILNSKEDQLVGTNLRRFVNEENWTKIRNETESRQKGKANRYELVFHRPDGSTRNVQISASPLFDSEGCFAGSAGIVLDVTELKKAEENLEKERQDLDCIVDSSPIIIFYKDKAGRFMRVNKAFAEALRTPKEGFLGKTVFDFYSAKIAQGMANDDSEVLESGRPKLGIIEQYESASGMRWVQTDKVPIFDKHGIPVGLVGFSQDITERKKSEELLRESEERFRDLYESILDPVGIFVGREGRLIEWNIAFKKLSGYTDEELKDKVFLDFVHPDYHAIVLEKYRTTYSEKELPLVYEIRGLNKKGEAIPLEISVSAYRRKGKVIGIEVIHRDITERKEMEERLRESEQKFRDLYESIQEPVAIYVGKEGHLIDYNSAFKKLTGYADEELKDKTFLDLTHPDDRAMVLEKYRTDYPEEELPLVYEVRGLNKKGETDYLEVSVNAYKKKGRVLGIEVISRVITERKKMEEELRESDERIRNLYESVPDSLAVYVGREGHIIECNRAFKKWSQYTDEDLKNKVFLDFVHPDDRALVMEKYRTKYSEDQFPIIYEIRTVNKKGECHPTEISVGPYRTKGRIIGINVMHRDITERKRMEKGLRESEKKLEIMNEKLRVTGGLTRHDVRNKLSAITGNVYLLKKQLAGDSSALDRLRDMEAAVEQTVRIFDFAKAYEMLGVEELVYVDVEKAVNEAISLFSSLKNVKVTNDCAGLSVLADSLLRQLFYNLIDNSLKYGQKTNTIRVSFEKTDQDQLKLVYEDDGVGIPAANKPELFKEGYSTRGSTGYGLYLIKKMMEVYGWTIQETSAPGEGAQFTITIPKTNTIGKENYQLN